MTDDSFAASPEADAADLLEQDTADRTVDPRRHEHAPDVPVADALEQDVAVDGVVDEPASDSDRVEPVDEAEYEYENENEHEHEHDRHYADEAPDA